MMRNMPKIVFNTDEERFIAKNAPATAVGIPTTIVKITFYLSISLCFE